MDQVSETEDYLLVEFIKVPFTHSAWNNHPLTNIIEIFYKKMKKYLYSTCIQTQKTTFRLSTRTFTITFNVVQRLIIIELLRKIHITCEIFLGRKSIVALQFFLKIPFKDSLPVINQRAFHNKSKRRNNWEHRSLCCI